MFALLILSNQHNLPTRMKVLFTSIAALCFNILCIGQTNLVCSNHQIYTVQHQMLQKNLGEDVPITYVGPKYKKGLVGIKEHLSPLFTEKKIGEFIVQIYISFVVNCQGKANNFKIINELNNSNTKDFATSIIKQLEALPKNWEPASKYNAKIDSYQVLELVIVQGNIQNIQYK